MSLASNQSLIENNVSQASNEFGIRVLNAITAANDGNQVISPLSLTTALGMLHLGANGETNVELRQLLGYNAYNIADSEAHNAYNNLLQQIRDANQSQRQYVELNVANRVMIKNGHEILVKYRDLLQINYDANIQEVDFAKNGENAIKTINEWVADKTDGKIKSLFTAPLPALTRLIVVNAVYLKANWIHEFKPYSTMKDAFYNNGNTITAVDMMHNAFSNNNFTASEELDAEILEMPYIGGDISMYIVLPRELNGLQKTASLLTEQKLNSAIKSMSSTDIDLYLPKFKIEVSYSLIDELKSLGLVNIFTISNADLSGITGHRDLYLSDVVHKVFLAVDEESTEASVATVFEAAEYGSSRVIPPPKEFKIDHPFILVIRNNKTNHNLFYGQISQL